MGTQVSVGDAASWLSMSPQRVRELCRQGRLSAAKNGRAWAIEKGSVERFGLETGHLVAGDHAVLRRDASSNGKPIALSFFSGAMGLDLGVEKAGFDVRLACEIDKHCRQTIALNRPEMALLSNINEYSASGVREAAGLADSDEIDLVMGGPPCQAFSTAGKRQGFNDDRGNVFLKFVDLAIELGPRYIVIENVRGLLSCPLKHRPHDQRGPEYPDLALDELRGGALYFVLSELRQAGYGYSFDLYNAANFGTPQKRERVVLVCSRDGRTPPYLTPTHSETGEHGLPKWRTFRQATRGIKEHHHLNFPEKRLQYYRMLDPGQNWRNLPEDKQKEALGKSYYAGGGKTGFLRRLAWDEPSPTLVTHPATDLAHPEEDRPLSIEEYERLQEFEAWHLAGPLVQRYKQVGNAVPLGLGHAVGLLVRRLLDGEEIPQFLDFRYSRYKHTNDVAWEERFAGSGEEALTA